MIGILMEKCRFFLIVGMESSIIHELRQWDQAAFRLTNLEPTRQSMNDRRHQLTATTNNEA